MGRRKKKIDNTALLGMRREGKNLREISQALDASIPTLSRRIAYLKHHEGLLTKYRELQGLQLTELQAKLLSVIDDDRIDKASLIEIAKAYEVLTKAQISIQGKNSFKKGGLVDHILKLENDPIK